MDLEPGKPLSPVEVTTSFAAAFADLAGAWAFVMERIDRVGDDPQISIRPCWHISSDYPDAEPERRFEVQVSGMVPEGGTAS
jgi:hypothetical protein